MDYQSNPQLELAENYLRNTGVSIFLTGKAGTGKTTFLRNVLGRLNKRYVIVAPTGVAAINAGGVTIHSFFQLPLCPYLPDVPELITEYQMPEGKKQLRKSRIDILRTLDVLIIDEISMVRADLLDAVDYRLRRYRRSNKPFGGVQLLMIGDIHQLPPVVTNDEEPYISRVYASPFFFESKAFKQLRYVTIELTTVYRQQDGIFLSMLNRVRENKMDRAMLDMINERYQPNVDEYFKDRKAMPIQLTTHNAQADRINNIKLSQLKGKEHVLEARVDGNFPESSYPTEKQLRLKVGTQVMFVKNDPQGGGRYYNGKIGVVTAIDRDENTVCVESEGENIEVSRVDWENVKYDINPDDKSIRQIVDGTFVQYPLRLAWAVTIHKAQGLTFDSVIVDAADAFAYGQVYVALSRCRTLEGLVLSSRISSSCTFDDCHVESFNDRQLSETQVRANYEMSAFQYYIDMLHDMLSPKQLYEVALRLDHFHRAYIVKLLPKVADQWNEYTRRLDGLADVHTRFKVQLERMTTNARSSSEATALIADRVAKAVDYFAAQYEEAAENMLPMLDIEIDNKEHAKEHQELAGQFESIVGLKNACLSHVKAEGFTVQNYQKAKYDYLLGNAETAKSKEKNKKKKQERKTAVATNYNVRYPELLSRLIIWRRNKYEELGVPAYVVMSQKSLLGIADRLPCTPEELSHISGIGKNRLKMFGEELLVLVRQFREDSGI